MTRSDDQPRELFTVDTGKCTPEKALCLSACPTGVIRIDAEGFPAPIPGANELCIDCGHCVAVCPSAAITHRSMSPQECPPVDPARDAGAAEMEYFLRSRRSIRQYQRGPVPRETLARLVEMAGYAPSGHNRRPLEWLIFDEPAGVGRLLEGVGEWMRWELTHEPEKAAAVGWDMAAVVQQIEAGQDRIFRGAPHVIIAHAHQSQRLAATDAVIALSYLELAAPALGLGTCWAGFFMLALCRYPPLRESLGLPEGHLPLGAVMAGKPKVKFHRLPKRSAPPIRWSSER